MERKAFLSVGCIQLPKRIEPPGTHGRPIFKDNKGGVPCHSQEDHLKFSDFTGGNKNITVTNQRINEVDCSKISHATFLSQGILKFREDLYVADKQGENIGYIRDGSTLIGAFKNGSLPKDAHFLVIRHYRQEHTSWPIKYFRGITGKLWKLYRVTALSTKSNISLYDYVSELVKQNF